MEQKSIWREFSAVAYHMHFKMVLVVVLWLLIIILEIGMGIERVGRDILGVELTSSH